MPLSGAPQSTTFLDPAGLYGARWGWDFARGVYRENYANLINLAADPNWSFSRTAGGYGMTSGGVLNWFAGGVPRVVDQGLLVEQAATNLVLYSQDPTNAAWAKNTIGITTGFGAPDGTSTADLVTATAGGAALTQGFASSGTFETSIYVKASTSTDSHFGLYDYVAGGWAGRVDIAWSGGVPTATLAFGTNTTTQALAGGWYRISASCVIPSGHTFALYIRPDITGLTNAIYFWGAQIELGSFATSYIPTTSVAVTRDADVAKILAGWFPPGAARSVVAKYQEPAFDGASIIGSDTGFGALQTASSGRASSYNGANIFADPTFTVGSNVVAGVSSDASGARMIVAAGSAPATGAGGFGAGTDLYIGGLNSPNIYIQRVLIFDRALSASDLVAITAGG